MLNCWSHKMELH